MRKPTLKERLQYRFDNVMSRGTAALIAALAIITILVVAAAAALIAFGKITQTGGEHLTFIEAAWESLVRTLDSGTFGADTGWAFRLVMLGVTLGGVFVVSALIGIINNGLEQRMEEMRKGR